MLLALSALASAGGFDTAAERACTEMELGQVLVPATGEALVMGSGPTRNIAWGRAQTAAARQFGNGSRVREGMVMYSLRPWCVATGKVGTLNLGREITVLGSLEAKVAASLASESELVERQLGSLAASLLTASGGMPLVINATSWPSGCPSDVGGFLGDKLASRLAASAPGAVVAQAPEGQSAAPVRLSIASSSENAVLTARLGNAGELVGSVEFRPDVFGLEPGELGSCHTDAELALPSTQGRAGRSGLVASVDAPIVGGVACEGQRARLSAYTSAAADLHVFSVDGAGRSFHIWPAMPGGPTTGRVDLGESDLLPSPAGDERLVAVAFPASSSVAAPAAWRGFCQLSAPLDVRSLHADVAIGTAGFVVHPAGTFGCRELATEPVEQALAEVPICE